MRKVLATRENWPYNNGLRVGETRMRIKPSLDSMSLKIKYKRTYRIMLLRDQSLLNQIRGLVHISSAKALS